MCSGVADFRPTAREQNRLLCLGGGRMSCCNIFSLYEEADYLQDAPDRQHVWNDDGPDEEHEGTVPGAFNKFLDGVAYPEAGAAKQVADFEALWQAWNDV